jgi:hypothetical protein
MISEKICPAVIYFYSYNFHRIEASSYIKKTKKRSNLHNSFYSAKEKVLKNINLVKVSSQKAKHEFVELDLAVVVSLKILNLSLCFFLKKINILKYTCLDFSRFVIFGRASIDFHTSPGNPRPLEW